MKKTALSSVAIFAICSTLYGASDIDIPQDFEDAGMFLPQEYAGMNLPQDFGNLAMPIPQDFGNLAMPIPQDFEDANMPILPSLEELNAKQVFDLNPSNLKPLSSKMEEYYDRTFARGMRLTLKNSDDEITRVKSLKQLFDEDKVYGVIDIEAVNDLEKSLDVSAPITSMKDKYDNELLTDFGFQGIDDVNIDGQNQAIASDVVIAKNVNIKDAKPLSEYGVYSIIAGESGQLKFKENEQDLFLNENIPLGGKLNISNSSISRDHHDESYIFASDMTLDNSTIDGAYLRANNLNITNTNLKNSFAIISDALSTTNAALPNNTIDNSIVIARDKNGKLNDNLFTPLAQNSGLSQVASAAIFASKDGFKVWRNVSDSETIALSNLSKMFAKMPQDEFYGSLAFANANLWENENNEITVQDGKIALNDNASTKVLAGIYKDLQILNADNTINVDNLNALLCTASEVANGECNKTIVGASNKEEIPSIPTQPSIPVEPETPEITTPSTPEIITPVKQNAMRKGQNFVITNETNSQDVLNIIANMKKNAFYNGCLATTEDFSACEREVVNDEWVLTNSFLNISRIGESLSKKDFVGSFSFDTLSLVGTLENKLNLLLTPNNGHDQVYLKTSNANINQTNIKNLNLSSGDRVFFAYKDDSGKINLLRTRVNKYDQLANENSSGSVVIKNSNLDNIEVNSNLLALENISAIDSDFNANIAKISGENTLHGTFVKAIRDADISGTTTLDNSMIVVPQDAKISVNALTQQSGLSSATQAMAQFNTKDGYKVFRSFEDGFWQSGDEPEYEEFLEKTLSENTNVLPAIMLDDLGEPVVSNGKIVDIKYGGDADQAKQVQILKDLGVISEDGNSINFAKLDEKALSIFDAIGISKEDIFKATQNKIAVNDDYFTNSGEAVPNNVPDVKTVLDTSKGELTFDGAKIQNFSIKKYDKKAQELRDATRGANVNFYAFGSKGQEKLDDMPETTLNNINIKNINIDSFASVDENGYSDADENASFLAKNSINIDGAKLSNINFFAGEFIGAKIDGKDYKFAAAKHTNESGLINITNSKIHHTNVIGNKISAINSTITGNSSYDLSFITANELSAKNLTVIDGAVLVLDKAIGSGNTLMASASSINQYIKDELRGEDGNPLAAVFAKNAKDDFFTIGTTSNAITNITPASAKIKTVDGFNAWIIGTDKYINSIKDKDKINFPVYAALLGGEGSSDNAFFDIASGKVKAGSDFYTFLQNANALNDDGTIDFNALGGVASEKKLAISDQASIEKIQNAKDIRGFSTAVIDIDSALNSDDFASLSDKTIKAKNLTIKDDIKGFDLDLVASEDGVFASKDYGVLNIEGTSEKKIQITNESIKTNELNAKNTIISAKRLSANSANLENITIKGDANEDSVITFSDAVKVSGKISLIPAEGKAMVVVFNKANISDVTKYLEKSSGVSVMALSDNELNIKAVGENVVATIGTPTSETAKIAALSADANMVALADENLIELKNDKIEVNSQNLSKELQAKLEKSADLKILENGDILVGGAKSDEEKLASKAEQNSDTQVIFTPSKVTKNEAAIKLAHGILQQANIAYMLEINNMSKRLGEIRNLGGTAGAWMRSYGGKGEIKDYENLKYHALHIGADKYIDDETLFGVMAGYSQQELDASGKYKSFMLGAYLSKIYENGFYFDSVLKYMRGKGDFKDSILGDSADAALHTKTQNAFLASFEMGYRMNFGNFAIEPAAEFITGYIPSSEITSDKVKMQQDGYLPLNIKPAISAIYSVNDSLMLKAGAGAIFDLNDGKVKYELSDSFGTNDTKTGKNTRSFINAAGSFKANKNTALGLEFEKTFGKDFKTDYNVNVNLRYQF